MRHITSSGLELIKRFEGFSARPYLCPAGYLTIGYGHVLHPREPLGEINESVAERLLVQDVRVAEQAVLMYIRAPLTDGQFDALASFAFNLGAGALQRSTLRRKVNEERHQEAAEEFHRWVWAGGRKLAGLIRRRAAEARLYLGCSVSDG